ncbi:MAG: RNA-binding domain-containing protein [bacterium]
MESRQTGTIKWFDPVKGFGFILCRDGSEVFVHHRDITDKQVRSLKKRQRVSFTIIEEKKGPKAVEIVIENEEPVEMEKAPKPPGTPVYRYGETVTVEEDREHEFKSLQKSKDPIKTIRDYYIAEYLNAFLNTNGGTILFGIENNGRVLGIQLDRDQRDALRREISKVVNKFQPSVEPELYKIEFVPIENKDSSWVVEIQVSKGNARLYMTGSQHFYLRRDGSNFLMPFDMIRARLLSAQAKTPLEDTKQIATDFLSQKTVSGDSDRDATLDLDLGILLAMVFMSWSESEITEEDIRLLETRAEDEGLEERDVAILRQSIHQPPLLTTIASYLPTPESKRAAATIAYLTALSDNELTEKELSAFEKMCRELGLSQTEQDEIRKLRVHMDGE